MSSGPVEIVRLGRSTRARERQESIRRSCRRAAPSSLRIVPELVLLDHDTVLAAVSASAAIEATRDAFLRHHSGEWVMPAKVYLESPPYGDFRAMPARGGDLALLKWVTSFPGNPAHGLPTVSGVVCLSDATHRRAARAARRARGDRAAHRRRRGRRDRWRSRATARARSASSAAGCTARGRRAAWSPPATSEGVCFDPRAEAAAALADELGAGWAVGDLRGRAGLRRRLHDHAGLGRRRRARGPAARPAPEHARRRRLRQGRGERRGGARL